MLRSVFHLFLALVRCAVSPVPMTLGMHEISHHCQTTQVGLSCSTNASELTTPRLAQRWLFHPGTDPTHTGHHGTVAPNAGTSEHPRSSTRCSGRRE